MRIAVGSDHAGFELKQQLVREMTASGYDVIDLGAHQYDALDDYPDFAELVGLSVVKGEADRGVMICGSGVGACIAANKIKGVRAGSTCDTYSAHQGVEHDDMNVLTLGSRITGSALASEILHAFLSAEFSGDERHVRRLNKVLQIEERGS